MKIKVGSTYQSIVSPKFQYKIVHEDSDLNKDFPLLAIQLKHGKKSGLFFWFNEHGATSSNATPILQEIPRTLELKLNDLFKWAAKDLGGTWFLYTQTPRLSGAIWVSDGAHIRIPKNLAPKWNCDYQDSLTQL